MLRIALVLLVFIGGCSSDSQWESAIGDIESGVTVYLKASPEDEKPEPWFTVIDPFIENGDNPQMRVRYAATGKEGLRDRRATMRSPAAKQGLLVIKR